MKYQVTIYQIDPSKESGKYSDSIKIYEQTIEGMDVLEVIKAVNGLMSDTERAFKKEMDAAYNETMKGR